MKPERAQGRRIRSIFAALLTLALLAAAVVGVLYLWADLLYREAFGRESASAPMQTAHVTSFDLFAEETRHQTRSRISGWRSLVSSQELSIKGARGMLQATMYEPLSGEALAPWAIVFHGGLGSDREQVLDVACELSLAGYRVLTPDLYAHGQSEGDASTLGFGDAQDVRAWIEYIERAQMDARIVLFGQDEGAAAVLLAASGGLSDSVAAAAADSAFDGGFERMLQLSGNDAGVKSALLAAAFRNKTGMKNLKLSEQIAAAKTPLLLIHGTGDQDVPAWQSEDIAIAAGERAQLLYIEGAGHGLSRYVEPETYYDTLLRFFEHALEN